MSDQMPAEADSAVRKIKPANQKFALFTWTKLNILGNIHFLKASYAILILVPLIAKVESTSLGQYMGDLPFTLRLGYFASLLLSIAHMIYQGFCPPIIKRFQSPNDLYRGLLEIKALQMAHLPGDSGFVFDIKHCTENFATANYSSWFARLACAFLYVAGLSLIAVVVVERSFVVLGWPLCQK